MVRPEQGAQVPVTGLPEVLSPMFLEGLAGAEIEELRRRRDTADQAETDLSFLRRLLQGRLDLVAAEQQRRSGSAPAQQLEQTLSEHSRAPAHGLGRHLSIEPTDPDALDAYVHSLVAADLTDPTARNDAELREALTVLQLNEASVSAARRQVQVAHDTLTGEIGRRYRDGEQTVSTLLDEAAQEPGTV